MEKNIDLYSMALPAWWRTSPTPGCSSWERPAKKHYMQSARGRGVADKVIFTASCPMVNCPSSMPPATRSPSRPSSDPGPGAPPGHGQRKAGRRASTIERWRMIRPNENGFLFEEDPVSCAEAMRTHRTVRRRFDKALRSTAERYFADESGQTARPV